MTFRAFCKEVARVDGDYQYTSTILNDPRVRDFLADAIRDHGLPEPLCWLELRQYIEARFNGLEGALLGAARTYRDYRALQRRGLA